MRTTVHQTTTLWLSLACFYFFVQYNSSPLFLHFDSNKWGTCMNAEVRITLVTIKRFPQVIFYSKSLTFLKCDCKHLQVTNHFRGGPRVKFFKKGEKLRKSCSSLLRRWDLPLWFLTSILPYFLYIN